MKRMIYYPGFETVNDNWLKFTLLYMEQLSPIVPDDGEKFVSESFQRVRSESDLIQVHRPQYDEGYRATLDALDQLDKILKHPEQYESIFKTRDVVARWRDPASQTVELFRGKFVQDWESVCVAERLATQTNYGICVSEELADVYMTVLAQVIADSTDASAITDQRSLDAYSLFIRRPAQRDEQAMRTAQGVIDLKLPGNIEDLSLEDVIRHRNRPGAKEKRSAFNDALNEFITKSESTASFDDFFPSLRNIWSDLTDDILKVGLGDITFGLGFWMLLASPVVDTMKAAQALVGGAGVAVGSVITIRNAWKHTKPKRLARRFLTDLKILVPSSPGMNRRGV